MPSGAILEGVKPPPGPATPHQQKPNDGACLLRELFSWHSGKQWVDGEPFAGDATHGIDPDIRCGFSSGIHFATPRVAPNPNRSKNPEVKTASCLNLQTGFHQKAIPLVHEVSSLIESE